MSDLHMIFPKSFNRAVGFPAGDACFASASVQVSHRKIFICGSSYLVAFSGEDEIEMGTTRLI